MKIIGILSIVVFAILLLIGYLGGCFVLDTARGPDIEPTVLVQSTVEVIRLESPPPKAFLPESELRVLRDAARRYRLTEEQTRILLAIRKAENGPKGTEMGVLHPKARGRGLQVQASWAAGTVRNNYRRWETAGKPGTFIEFLGRRYCPPDAHALNQHWVSNVTYYASRA